MQNCASADFFQNHVISFNFQIIHLKRFQFLNGRWVKSQKIVKFPKEKEKFDPSAYLVERARRASMSEAKLSLTNGSTNHNRLPSPAPSSGELNN